MSVIDNDSELLSLLEDVEEHSEELNSYELRTVDYVSNLMTKGRVVQKGLREKMYNIGKRLNLLSDEE